MKKCQKCHTTNLAIAKFCEGCGGQSFVELHHKKNKGLLIAVLLLGMIVVGAGVFLLRSSEANDSPGAMEIAELPVMPIATAETDHPPAVESIAPEVTAVEAVQPSVEEPIETLQVQVNPISEMVGIWNGHYRNHQGREHGLQIVIYPTNYGGYEAAVFYFEGANSGGATAFASYVAEISFNTVQNQFELRDIRGIHVPTGWASNWTMTLSQPWAGYLEGGFLNSTTDFISLWRHTHMNDLRHEAVTFLNNIDIALETLGLSGQLSGVPAAVVVTPQTNPSHAYVLPTSHTSYLATWEVDFLSTAQLRIARNEIYARHGRMFVANDLQQHFNAQSWYTPRVAAADFSYGVFNSFEMANIELIQRVEAAR